MRTAITAILAVTAVVWAVCAAMDASANGRGSDIVRQWVVCQYVNDGRDPYSLAKDILAAKYGAGNPKRVPIYAIPKAVPAHREADVLPDIGPPEATYPPPAVGLLALSVGLLGDPRAVLWVWFAVNVLAAGWVAHLLTRLWPVPPGGATASDNYRLVVAALLLFPATYDTLFAGQFSLVVLGLLLVASDPSRPWPPRGLALGVALLKPSVALPFFFLPVVRREWRVILGSVAVQAAVGGYVAFRTGGFVGPYRDWLAVAGFFLNGLYTVQEWLNAFSGRAPWLVSVVPPALLVLCAIALAVGRRLPPARLFALAAITSVFWTYHGAYDFVFLLPVLLPLAGWSDNTPGKRWSAVGIVLFAIVAMALIPAVITAEDVASKAVRWAARVVVIGLFAWEYLRVYRSPSLLTTDN